MDQSYMTKTKKMIHTLLKRYLESIFDIDVNNEVTGKLEPPYLLVGNHQNNWDGFLISVYVNEPISFVISDEQFRQPILRGLLNYINAIPTIKARVDISTIKRLIKAKNEKRVLGLYPEGNRTWDGKTEPIYYSTAKLIKLLDIPVVVTKSKGGYLAHPRWAKYRRRGKITLTYELLFTREQIKQASVDELYLTLCDTLEHDEIDYQTKNMLTFTGKKLAEKLENFLFACPHCHSIDKMKSANNLFTCEECGYSVEYTKYGLFQPKSEKLYFNNLRDWNEWQLEYLKSLIIGRTEPQLMVDDGVILKQGERFKSLKAVSTGKIFVDSKNFYYKTQKGDEQIIPIEHIDGLNLQVRNQLDIYYNDYLYRFSFEKSTINPYKWFKTIEILRKELKNKDQKQAKA